MRLHDLLGGIDVLELRGRPDVDVTAVVHDSRNSAPGALFCCIPGALTDGHEHAPEAARHGATALLVERFVEVGADVAQARVASVRRSIGPVAARLHGDPSRSMRVLGVTGTNGKTTTTYLLEAIATAHGERVGVVGTVETRFAGQTLPPGRTTPEATDLQEVLARMRDAGVTTVAMEVSSHALDQHRVDGTRFAAACFTNLSQDHLDYHHDLDSYFDAKASLFEPARVGAAAVNLDDPRGAALIDRCARLGVPVRSFGVASAGADVRATQLELGPAATAFTLETPVGHERVTCRLVGEFNVSNALAAAATALAGGLPLSAVVAGLEAGAVVPGRVEPVDAGQAFPVLVDYAHTPDALERVLAAVRPLVAPGGRLIVVYGCGGDRDRAKRPLMGAAASQAADLAFVTSDNPRGEEPGAIVAEILGGVPATHPTVVELDRRLAIREAVRAAQPGDAVVIAGKGHETGQTAGGVTRDFDDRVVAREELEALGCS